MSSDADNQNDLKQGQKDNSVVTNKGDADSEESYGVDEMVTPDEFAFELIRASLDGVKKEYDSFENIASVVFNYNLLKLVKK